eukprot:gnl/MRDRNA2_/MRDRNA2_17814_c0_seq1.p1 gnl/MRDRNA2_/MRDRNA2_17814_c0~~gnl/MRDRNA2_/MRDRNA2_17814_c0_seq1.p1  ORF type:complete len:106 (+),score=27.60 gnl/MRDRNA2_/MRDRNA2_17814_c0_seq1:111-428(+)
MFMDLIQDRLKIYKYENATLTQALSFGEFLTLTSQMLIAGFTEIKSQNILSKLAAQHNSIGSSQSASKGSLGTTRSADVMTHAELEALYQRKERQEDLAAAQARH